MASGHLIHESGALIHCAVSNKIAKIFLTTFLTLYTPKSVKTYELTSTNYYWFLYDLVCFITEKVPMNRIGGIRVLYRPPETNGHPNGVAVLFLREMQNRLAAPKPSAAGSERKGRRTPSVGLTSPAAAYDLMAFF